MIASLSDLRGLLFSDLGPAACAVGCILMPLRGWDSARLEACPSQIVVRVRVFLEFRAAAPEGAMDAGALRYA